MKNIMERDGKKEWDEKGGKNVESNRSQYSLKSINAMTPCFLHNLQRRHDIHL